MGRMQGQGTQAKHRFLVHQIGHGQICMFTSSQTIQTKVLIQMLMFSTSCVMVNYDLILASMRSLLKKTFHTFLKLN